MKVDLFLFSTDANWIARHVEAGVAGVVIDWEARGKRERQRGYDTQINQDTPADLARVRRATRARILCRVNGWGPASGDEIEQAIEGGTDEILLPMVREPSEVEAALRRVRGRAGLGILIETRDALRNAAELARLPLSRVYVGLNDLAIERGSPSIFEPLVDGTLDRLRPLFDVPFGAAGLTLPEGGDPVPCRVLMSELARLEVDFSFLRRSYHRDAAGRDPRVEIPRIRGALRAAAAAGPERKCLHRQALRDLIGAGARIGEAA